MSRCGYDQWACRMAMKRLRHKGREVGKEQGRWREGGRGGGVVVPRERIFRRSEGKKRGSVLGSFNEILL